MLYGVILVVWSAGGLTVLAAAPAFVHAAVAKYRTTFATRSIINGYLRDHSQRKLQIGAGGNNMTGWLNTDIEPEDGQAYLDATARFPLPDRSFNYIYSEHVIEHLGYDGALTMLRECHRVLAPGGRLRVATPNLLKFVALFQEGRSEEAQRYIPEKLRVHQWPQTASPECLILNLQLRSWGHQFVFDPKTLSDLLSHAGFDKVAEVRCGESGDAALRGLEERQRTGFRNINGYETMVFEAVRN